MVQNIEVCSMCNGPIPKTNKIFCSLKCSTKHSANTPEGKAARRRGGNTAVQSGQLRQAGLLGAHKGGRAAAEWTAKHPEQASERGRKAGKIAVLTGQIQALGKIQGKKNVESGVLLIAATKGGHTQGPISGQKNKDSGWIQELGRKYGPMLGKTWGPINGRRRVESGGLAKLRTPEHQRMAGRAAGRKAAASGHLKKSQAKAIAASLQWAKDHPEESFLRNSKGGKKSSSKQKARMRELGRRIGPIVGPINILKAIAAQRQHPTHLEQRVFAIFLHRGLPFDFVGNARDNPIGGKYPDFVHPTKKIAVEVADKEEKEFSYNRRMKKAGKSTYSETGLYWKQYETERRAHFEKYGYACVVLWSDMSDEKMVELAGTVLKSV